MKITAIEAIPVAIPLNHPLKMAVATVSRRESLIVRIRTDAGLVGLGEAVIAPYFTGETQLGAKAAVDRLFAPVLIGMEVENLHANLARLNRVLHGNPSVKSALDVAFHDLLAQALQVPLYKLLGGKVRDRINSTWAISAEEPGQAASEALAGLEMGFNAIKIKVGMASLREDGERVHCVRNAIGDTIHLRADANQAWSPAEAIQFIRAVEDCRLQFVEQPVHREDMTGMARVAQAVDTPVAPDEGLFDAISALAHIRLAAADGAVLKLMKAGGIAGCRQLAAVLQAANLGMHLGGMPGQTSISAAAEVHLAVSLPGLNWEAGIYPHSIARDVVTEPLVPVGGAYSPPEKPGLGVELDEAALAACRVDR